MANRMPNAGDIFGARDVARRSMPATIGAGAEIFTPRPGQRRHGDRRNRFKHLPEADNVRLIYLARAHFQHDLSRAGMKMNGR